MAAGRRQSLLVCVPVLSSPVSCQNRKGQGREWRLGKRCLDVCWLEVQLCLTVTLPARKNRPVQGVTRSGILHGVIFITFTKHSEGCFRQLLTQVRVIFVSKTVRQRRNVPSGRVPLAGSLALDCSLCLGREILFDILLIMKARHSFSLDDPETSITIPFPWGWSCPAIVTIHHTYLLILTTGWRTHTHTHVRTVNLISALLWVSTVRSTFQTVESAISAVQAVDYWWHGR